MDRSSQEPPERPGPPSEAGGSPLSFPVEAPKLAGVEPGAGEPLSFPAEAAPPAFPVTHPVDADAFRAPAEQLPFPVAELPGVATAAPQPAPAAEPAPVPVTEAPPASGLLRVLSPVLTAVAALMTVGGCFLPLFRLQQNVSVRQGFFEAQLTVTETAWGSRMEIPGQDAADQGGAPIGLPLILAALVLAVAAFTAFSRPGHGIGRWLTGAGALFTAGAVTTVGMNGLGWSAMAEGMDLEVITAAGMWLLIGATVLAAVAAVLAYLPTWRRAGDDWADPTLAYADTPTPPTGVAITVLPPEEPG